MYEPLRLATQPLPFLLVATSLACRTGAATRWRRLAFAPAWLLVVACHPLSAWWLAHRSRFASSTAPDA